MSEQEARRGRQSKSLIRNEECVLYRSSSSFPHATLSVQPTLKGSTQRHRPRPSRPQNACIYATHHHHQKIQFPTQKNTTNCLRTFQRERKNPSTIQNTPSIPPRRKDLYTPCRFQPQEDRQIKGKEERGFGTSGKRRLVFLLIINCFFAFVYISCAYFSASLLLCSIPLASTRIPFFVQKKTSRRKASAAMA